MLLTVHSLIRKNIQEFEFLGKHIYLCHDLAEKTNTNTKEQ